VVLSLPRKHNEDQNGDPDRPKVEALLPAYFYYSPLFVYIFWEGRGRGEGLSSVSTSAGLGLRS
jgi:hypothetical protein